MLQENVNVDVVKPALRLKVYQGPSVVSLGWVLKDSRDKVIVCRQVNDILNGMSVYTARLHKPWFGIR